MWLYTCSLHFCGFHLQKISHVPYFVGEWSTSGPRLLYLPSCILYGGNLPKLGEFSDIGLMPWRGTNYYEGEDEEVSYQQF